MTRILAIGGFLLCGLAFVVLEALSRRSGARWAPLGELAVVVLRKRSTRVCVLVFWWWIGWHFFIER